MCQVLLRVHCTVLAQVIPRNQGLDKNAKSGENAYCGVFHFQLWHFGKWGALRVACRVPIGILFHSPVFLFTRHKTFI